MLPALKLLINMLFPARCIFCGSILDIGTETDICKSCFDEIPFYDDTLIKPDTLSLQKGGCDYIICACHYSGIVKDSLLRFKFFNKPGYYRAFAGLLRDKIKKMTDFLDFDIIISIPLHKQKEDTRGYNQSLLIAKELSKQLGIPEGSNLLRRVRYTRSQSLLAKAERYINVKDAFRVRDVDKISGRSILLVDDIFTTGSTLDECSRVLKAAGARMVVGAVIASGRKY